LGREYLEKNLALKRQMGADRRDILVTTMNLEIAHRILGRYDLALQDLDVILPMLRAEHDDRRIAAALSNRSQLYLERGNVEQAIADATESVQLLQRDGVERDANEAMATLATAHLAAGHYGEALDVSRRAAEFARSSNAAGLLWLSLDPAGQAA